MVLTVSRRLAALSLALLMVIAQPAIAHQHNDQQPALEHAGAAPATGGGHDDMASMTGHGEDDETQPTTMSGRLFKWMGNMHPFAVHFPIALFPISWIALIFARRRGDKADLIRAFVIVAGLAALAAAVLGWLNAGFELADRDPIRLMHRWTGTTLALIGALLALWAWRRASAIDNRLMVWALGFVTVALLIQGWLGAVLTHGIGHMMF